MLKKTEKAEEKKQGAWPTGGANTRRHLQVLLVVVVDDGQEDGHEDVGVHQKVQDEEDGKEGAGVVRWHPAVMEHDGEMHHFLCLRLQKKQEMEKKAHMASGLLAVVTRT